MAQQDAVIRLLLVEDRLEDAEQLISHLRNGGLAVRPHRPENEDDLVEKAQAHLSEEHPGRDYDRDAILFMAY